MIYYELSKNEFNPDETFQRELYYDNPVEYQMFMTQNARFTQKFTELFNNNDFNFIPSFFARTNPDSLIVAIDNKKIVGVIFAQRFSDYDNCSNLDDSHWFCNFVLVDKAYRGLGVGSELCTKCVQRAKEYGCKYFSASFLSDGKGQALYGHLTSLSGLKQVAPVAGADCTCKVCASR